MLTRYGVPNTTMILNAPQITHKTRHTKTLAEPLPTTRRRRERPLRQPQCKPCVLTGSRHTRLQNLATHRTTPGNTGRNQPKAQPRHRRQLDRKAHKPACNISPERKGPPGSRIVPRNSTHLISESAYRHHQPVRFLFFCPIFPRCSKTQNAIGANNPYSVSARIVID